MRVVLSISFFFLALISVAQETNIKLGEVEKNLLEQEEHEMDKDADAAILYKKERLRYDYDGKNGFKYIRDVHLRIKVYKKAGLDWGTLRIPLYDSGTAAQTFYGAKGYTFNIEEGKVTKDKLDKDGIFTENINKYSNQISITMPNVKVGSIIDLEYQIGSDLIGYMNPFVIQYGVPVNEVDIKVDVPEYFNFKKHIKGFYPVAVQEVLKSRRINYQYKEEQTESVAFSDVNRRPEFKRSTLNFMETSYVLAAKDIPAMKEENFTDNINNYRSAIFFELESTKFPNYGYKMYSQTWEDVAGAIYRYDDFGGEIDEDRVFRKEVDVLIESHKGKPELAGAIFNFVKSKMVWNGYYGVGCENGIKNAFEKGKGNVADINLMLTSMLRYAGFNANPVLVSTKDHGIPLFPTMDGFNYVIAAIELEQGYLLLDATENILGINQLPVRAINWSGRLVREDGTSKSVSLIPEQISEKNIFMNVEFQEDGKVDGKMQTRFTNHLAYEYRKEVGSKTKEQLKDYISAIYDGTEIEKLENENLKNSNAQLTETLEFTKDGVMEIIGDRAYFSPMLFLANKENPFKMEKREYPIDLDYSKKEKVTINFSIPSGFAIESIPESMALGLPDDQGTFNYTIRQNGSNIQLVCIKETKSAMLSPILYEPLREFYEQVVQKENDKVVLVKTKS